MVCDTTLKVAIMVLNNLVSAQILEMSEALRCKDDFQASNGFRIKSYSCTELEPKTFFIRGGDQCCDEAIVHYACHSRHEAIRYADEIAEAIKEFTHNENSVSIFKDNEIFKKVKHDGTLKLNILKWDNTLFIKNTDINDIDRHSKVIVCKGIEIRSSAHIQLEPNKLFLRGNDRSKDEKYAYCRFNNHADLLNFINGVTEGVKVWNNSEENTIQFFEFIPKF